MAKHIYVCPECGSDDVQAEAWVNANTNEIHDFVECADYWCNSCEQMHGQLCLVEKGHEHDAACAMHEVCTGDRITKV